MLEKRKRKWRRDFGWVEDDLDRIFRSVEALPEELQDFMKVWDSKWMARFDRLKVVVELAMRYMDDGRTLLHPFKAGWRWADGELVYCKRWEIEDRALSPVERTKRVLRGTMGGLEDFLTFTMETQEDFPSVWLATLDTDLQVTEQNRVEYNYYEKPTWLGRRAVQWMKMQKLKSWPMT